LKIVKRIRKLINWPIHFKWLLIKTCGLSLFYELCLRFNWYRFIKLLHTNNTTIQPENETTITNLQYVAKAMRILEKFAPWKPKCYNRALTAKKILLTQNIVTQMHIGFRKKEKEFDGHAWLTFNNKLVTGIVPHINEFEVLK